MGMGTRSILAMLVTTSLLWLPCPATGQGAPVAFPLKNHIVTDNLGRTVTYYLSQPRRPAPLLLMIQGSGCASVIQQQHGDKVSTLFDLLPLAAEERFAVMVVEKPEASPDVRGGSAEGCTAKFNEGFTAERWLVALRAALDDARGQPGVVAGRVVILGTSEGAVMASLLAGRDAHVTDVIAIGGSGTTQFFDFIAAAYARCFDRRPCIADEEARMAAIRADPNSATKFAWGHPYRRLTSFFSVEPGDELVRSKARVYLAFGTADTSTPPLSQEVAVAKLLAAGRDVTVRRVLDADHSLMGPAEGISALDREYRQALEWFWAGGKR